MQLFYLNSIEFLQLHNFGVNFNWPFEIENLNVNLKFFTFVPYKFSVGQLVKCHHQILKNALIESVAFKE